MGPRIDLERRNGGCDHDGQESLLLLRRIGRFLTFWFLALVLVLASFALDDSAPVRGDDDESGLVERCIGFGVLHVGKIRAPGGNMVDLNGLLLDGIVPVVEAW